MTFPFCVLFRKRRPCLVCGWRFLYNRIKN
nr:MAG TPA: hypothetical protein [Caudoviricetes sp.]